MEEAIRIVITGGTFDKQYDEIKGELTFRSTHLPEILKQVRCTVPTRLDLNQLKDSLDMSDESRRQILTACSGASESMIVITHGTDTMCETARMIGEVGLEKTIVLTGAMVPYMVTGSDAIFNLGCAIAAVQVLEHGVYIAMNGRTFGWQNVRKDREHGFFVEESS